MLGDFLPRWDSFDPSGKATLILAEKPRLERHPRRAEFGIWAGKTWTSGTWWDLGL